MQVLLPQTLDEACTMLAESQGRAVPIAGGTDLIVHWPCNIEAHQKAYLDISTLDELKFITLSGDSLIVGAMTTFWETITSKQVESEFPLLVQSAKEIGSVQIQTRGTWAGNIANASPAADGVLALMAYDASVTLISTHGTREIPLHEYFLDYKCSQRQPDELIHSFCIPRRSFTFDYFEKVGSRQAQTITKVGVAITNSSSGWRVVANSVAPMVRRCYQVEQLLEKKARIQQPDDLLAALDQDVSPIDDIRSTAAYRRCVLSRLIYYALREHCPWYS